MTFWGVLWRACRVKLFVFACAAGWLIGSMVGVGLRLQ